MMTALLALPLIGMMGFAVDYSIVTMTKAKLDQAADAAAVAAITKAKTVIGAGGSTSSGIDQGRAQGIAAFNANAGVLGFAVPPQPTVTIQQSGQSLTASVSYAADSNSQFGKLFGITYNHITSTSASSAILTPYYQFIFVVDISGSMAIGGTARDITGMVNDPRIGCAFACHDPYNKRGPNYRLFAKNDGWTLKIDYVNQAIQNFLQDLKTQTANRPGVFSVGIDTFATYFNVVQAPTTNISASINTAAQIDIEPMDYLSVSQGYTRTTSSLLQALSNLNNIGDGSSVSKQATYIIFLSDGVEDIEGNQIYGRGTDVSYTSACTTIKQTGATLISIVAPYPVVNDNQYPILVAPIANQLAPQMKACASDASWAYKATDGPGIDAAVQAVLQKIIQGMTRLIPS